MNKKMSVEFNEVEVVHKKKFADMDDAKIMQTQAENHFLGVLGSVLETKDIKMTIRFKSLKALRNMNERLSQFHDEYCTECDSNFTIHLLIRNFTQRVTVNIPRGKNKKSQVQGLKNVEDLRLVIARLGKIGLYVMEKPQLSGIICTSARPLLNDLFLGKACAIGKRGIRAGHAKVYFKSNGDMTMIGRNWNQIELFVDFLAKHVIQNVEPNVGMFPKIYGIRNGTFSEED